MSHQRGDDSTVAEKMDIAAFEKFRGEHERLVQQAKDDEEELRQVGEGGDAALEQVVAKYSAMEEEQQHKKVEDWKDYLEEKGDAEDEDVDDDASPSTISKEVREKLMAMLEGSTTSGCLTLSEVVEGASSPSSQRHCSAPSMSPSSPATPPGCHGQASRCERTSNKITLTRPPEPLSTTCASYTPCLDLRG